MGNTLRMRLNELCSPIPLYQRARSIAEAMSAFCAHCDRDAAWYEGVDEGLEPMKRLPIVSSHSSRGRPK